MSDRGEQYADGGTGLNDLVHYPDPERIRQMHICWRDDPSPERCIHPALIGVPIDLTCLGEAASRLDEQ